MIPFSASAQTAALFDATAPHSAVQGKPRLLLVDDEPRLLLSLYELLQGRGYQLITASSACVNKVMVEVS